MLSDVLGENIEWLHPETHYLSSRKRLEFLKKKKKKLFLGIQQLQKVIFAKENLGL